MKLFKLAEFFKRGILYNKKFILETETFQFLLCYYQKILLEITENHLKGFCINMKNPYPIRSLIRNFPSENIDKKDYSEFWENRDKIFQRLDILTKYFNFLPFDLQIVFFDNCRMFRNFDYSYCRWILSNQKVFDSLEKPKNTIKRLMTLRSICLFGIKKQNMMEQILTMTEKNLHELILLLPKRMQKNSFLIVEKEIRKMKSKL